VAGGIRAVKARNRKNSFSSSASAAKKKLGVAVMREMASLLIADALPKAERVKAIGDYFTHHALPDLADYFYYLASCAREAKSGDDIYNDIFAKANESAVRAGEIKVVERIAALGSIGTAGNDGNVIEATTTRVGRKRKSPERKAQNCGAAHKNNAMKKNMYDGYCAVVQQLCDQRDLLNQAESMHAAHRDGLAADLSDMLVFAAPAC
jgi:hypothetical protein